MIKIIEKNGTAHELKGVRVVSQEVTAYESSDNTIMKQLYGPNTIQAGGLVKVPK